MGRLEFSPQILSLAQLPHVQIAAKAADVPPEYKAVQEAAKRFLIAAIFTATDKSDHEMLYYMLANPENKVITEALRVIGVALKHKGKIEIEEFKYIDDILGDLEQVPSFNRNKAMYLFIEKMAEAFREVEAPEIPLTKEELREIVREEVKAALEEYIERLSTVKEKPYLVR